MYGCFVSVLLYSCLNWFVSSCVSLFVRLPIPVSAHFFQLRTKKQCPRSPQFCYVFLIFQGTQINLSTSHPIPPVPVKMVSGKQFYIAAETRRYMQSLPGRYPDKASAAKEIRKLNLGRQWINLPAADKTHYNNEAHRLGYLPPLPNTFLANPLTAAEHSLEAFAAYPTTTTAQHIQINIVIESRRFGKFYGPKLSTWTKKVSAADAFLTDSHIRVMKRRNVPRGPHRSSTRVTGASTAAITTGSDAARLRTAFRTLGSAEKALWNNKHGFWT